MNKQFENTLDMYAAVIILLKQKQEIYIGAKAFVDAFAEFEAVIKEINLERKITEDGSEGVTRKKKEAKRVMIDHTVDIESQMFAFAERSKDTVLQGQMSHTESAMKKMRGNLLVSIGEKLLETAREKLPLMADYNLTADKLDQFEASILEFKSAISKPRAKIVENKSVRSKIHQLFEESDNILKKQLDRMMKGYKEDHIDFYKAYFDSRKVVKYGTRYEKPVDNDETKDDSNAD